MSNIQKEISQLEHWLTNLHDDTHVPNPPCHKAVHSNDELFELSNLHRTIDIMTGQIGNQQHTLNNVLERLDFMENFRGSSNREIYIDENQQHNSLIDPWINNHCEPLQNEIIAEDDNISVPLYTINKNTVFEESSVATPSIIPDVPEDRSLPPDIDSEEEKEEEKEEEEEKISIPSIPIHIPKQSEEKEDKVESLEEEEKEDKVESLEEEEGEGIKEEGVKEEGEEEEIEEEEEEEEIEEEEVEEEVEEEEEGLELEEIDYNNIKYYKDNDGFIYSIDDEDQPSENPIGYWKKKTNSIAFYKTT